MPIKTVQVKCARCGQESQIITKRPSIPYWICESCKAELEWKPKELMRHVGLAVEAEYREQYDEGKRS